MITLATIEQQTREYAAIRRAMLDQAAQVQSEIDAVRAKHDKSLRKRVQRMTEAHEALWAQIEANPQLFPEGSRSTTFDGIKVGFQKGKAKLQYELDHDNAITYIKDLLDGAPDERKLLIRACVQTTYKFVDAAVKKLEDDERREFGATLIPAVDSVLVMPQEDDTTKAVDSLIKAMQTDIADGN